MDEETSRPVLVQVTPIEAGREIGWSASVAEQLGARIDDLRQAIAEGTRAVAESLPELGGAAGWRLNEVSASFGLALTAEAGVILSKASAATTFDVTVSFARAHDPPASRNTEDV
jgi:Trypsin-co-occurring domain 1